MGSEIVVRPADAGGADLPGMAEVLADCVAGGASVGFMLPFDVARATAFWAGALDGAARGERIVLVALDTGEITGDDSGDGVVVGTVQVILAAPENQPHRGEIAKMLVHRRARRRGGAEALMRAAKTAAADAGKTLLVLDTASPEAARLYDRLGWQRLGVIPDYALWPAGGFVDSLLYYKRLTAPTTSSAPTAPATSTTCATST